MKVEYRVTKKEKGYYFRVIKGRKKVFEKTYKNVDSITTASFLGKLDYNFPNTTGEVRNAILKSIEKFIKL